MDALGVQRLACGILAAENLAAREAPSLSMTRGGCR